MGKTVGRIRFLMLSLFVFFCADFLFASDDSLTIITIKNARETSYQKDGQTGDDTIALEGAVEISVAKGSSVSDIRADRVTYDRKTEMLFAEGNVRITTKTSSSGGESTTAERLLLNTATLEGIFDDGRVVQTQSDAINLPSGSTLIVFSDIFGKTENNVIAFKDASLSFCDDEDDPHWKINASRIWLLPGGEFAFFNAFLYVGQLPVLYLPAFYYPKDELLFNPVFGVRNRTGLFLQTTTYLYGRKPLSSSAASGSSSDSDAAEESVKALYNFMKPSALKVQERQGLMLHNLDENFTGSTDNYVKLMADWYQKLGAFVGVDGSFTLSSSYVSSIKFNAMLGFSNTVFATGGSYNPFSSSGQRYYDYSKFMGLFLPFRYAANFSLSLKKPFTLSLSLPVYSDPYFAYDFLSRSESLDWISYLMALSKGDTSTASITETSSFVWSLGASYTPSLPEFIKPYVSSFSVRNNSTVNFNSASSLRLSEDSRASGSDGWAGYTPERKYYYPSQVTPSSASLSVSGTLFEWPKKSTAAASAKYEVALAKPEGLMTEAEKKALEAAGADGEKAAPGAAGDAAEAEAGTETDADAGLPFPSIATPSVTAASERFSLAYTLGYSITPSFSSQLAYSASELGSADDFDWRNVRSTMYTIKAPAELSSTLTYGGGFVSVVNKLAYSPVWQRHPNTDGYGETQSKALVLADYKAETQDITSTNTVTLKPFVLYPHFADTAISWNTAIKLFRREFIGDADAPDWEYKGADWSDSKSVTAHSLNLTLAANEMNSKFKQSVVFSSTLAPQLPKYSGTLSLVFPYVTATLSQTIQETSLEDSTLIYNPLQQSLSFSMPVLGSSLSLTESYNYNWKEWHSDSLKLSLSWWNLSASYVMSYTYAYDLVKGSGWIAQDKKSYIPYTLSLSYTTPSKTFRTWGERITFVPKLSTGIVADLVRPTNSYFTFTPSLTFKINDFLDLTFSATSRNSSLYWYFNDGGTYDSLGDGAFVRMLADLARSFNFFNEADRKASGFKLKTLALTLSHDLHDWSFNLSWKFEPRLVTKNGSRYYDYNPYFSIGVVWNPMGSIKTEIVDNYGSWELN